jgi:hypothetical protein
MADGTDDVGVVDLGAMAPNRTKRAGTDIRMEETELGGIVNSK